MSSSKPSLRRSSGSGSGSESESGPGPAKRTRRSSDKRRLLQAFATLFSEEDGQVPEVFVEAVQRFCEGSRQASASVEISHGPSDFASRKTWKKYMFRETPPPPFLPYRGPRTAKPPIPLVLVDESFSRFVLDLESREIQLSEDDYQVAEEIYKMFSEGFDDEVMQMNEGELSECFCSYLRGLSFRQMGALRMDGFITAVRSRPGEPRHVLFLFEDKTDDGPNGYFEGLEVCRRMLSKDSTDSHCMLVLRRCPYIIFAAAVMDRKNDVLLAEPLAHIPFWGPEYGTVLRGAKAMRALKNFCWNYVIKPEIDASLPFAIAGWHHVSRLSSTSMVFRVTSPDGNCMVAKFTQHYSREAHEAWQRKGLAPELYDVKDLGAGWKFVSMEYLSEEAGWHSLAEYPLFNGRQLLTDFLRKGHDTGYVHGDFRPPNLLVKDGETLKAIDFDWSGREGIARYPIALNPDLEWEPTARRGAIVTKIHDMWHVDNFSNVHPQVACASGGP